MSVPPADPQLYFEQLRNDGLCAEDARRRVRFRFRQHRADPIDPDDPVHLRAEHRRLEADRGEIERQLHEAEALITALEEEVRLLTCALVVRRQPVLGQTVGAGASRTQLLVRARTLVRRAVHPDTRHAFEARHATEEFQRAEALFDELLERS